MNFTNTQYIPHIIIGSIAFTILILYLNNKYFKWVKTYWFYERSWLSHFSTFTYILSLLLMLISLLDLRGPEEKVKINLADQKTIIILDSSSSMLAEDVRPSRFGKAIQLARHFVKNAAGHQISVVLFSDIQKRLIPFTDDIDLLDSRLAALEKTNAISGGSNIGQAIAEAIGYFDTSGDRKSAQGNILVFTDAEESDGSFDLEIGSNINLAVVGIGTLKGANIPLRWEDGSFRGYKNNKGEPITTKLDEEYIKKIGKNVKNYKYWIANSYSLPTDEIKDFFRATYNKSNGKSDMRVRPVFSHFILIPAIIMFCISVVLGRFTSFRTVNSLLIIFLLSFSSGTYAKDDDEKEKPLPEGLIKELNKMKAGMADRKEILKIAENLLKNNNDERANDLYTEYSKENDEIEVLFNHATALLKNKKIDEALPLIQQIYKSGASETIKDKMRRNLLLSLSKDDKDKEKNKDEKDDKNKEDKKDDKKDDKKKEEQDNKDKEDKKEDKSKDKKDGKDGKEKDSKDSKSEQDQNKDNKNEQDKEDDKKEEEKDKDGKDPKDLDKPDRPESAPKTMLEKEKMIEKKRKMMKTPAMVKQILNDDRELQKKLMDTSTNERGAPKQKRDW